MLKRYFKTMYEAQEFQKEKGGEIDKNPKSQVQRVNGQEYQVVTIKQQALFATATGKLKIKLTSPPSPSP